MIKISRLSDYAVVLLSQLAGSDAAALTTTKLADQASMPLPVVRKLMQQLRDAELVEALQGQRGGYRLCKSAEAINLYQIVTATQGDLALTQCTKADHGCQVQCHYHFEQHWQQINTAVASVLESVTLANMMSDAPLELVNKEAVHG